MNARTSATNYFNRPFQALSENVFIRADTAFSALETFQPEIYLLTYFWTYKLHFRYAGTSSEHLGQGRVSRSWGQSQDHKVILLKDSLVT